MKSAVIVSYARTPIGKFMGSMSSLSTPQLGSIAIRGAISRVNTNNDIEIKEAIIGNVVSAGIGQAPCRQAVLGASLPETTICTTINKVCASGMKSVMMASQMIECGGFSSSLLQNGTPQAVLAGGMESMSNIPRYIPRSSLPLGHLEINDGLIHDGLWDCYNNQHMGMCAEKCAKDYSITREEQDEHAISSYQRAIDAINSGIFKEEIESASIPQRRGKDPIIIQQDEEPGNAKLDKLTTLRPAFQRDNGTVTAGNASSINDAASAMILMEEENAVNLGLKPLARIRGYGDAAQNPVEFTTSPSLAVPVALSNAGNMKMSDVEYHEINEAFSVVALANMKILDLDPDKVNIYGGAVALGHPIGMSGNRIIGNLINVLKQKDATIGCASICNGGGGASAIVIERMN